MPDPSLTIAHVDPEMGFSGGEVQVFLLMEGLAKRGHRNVLLCSPGSDGERAAAARGIASHAVPMRNDLDLPAVRRLRRAISGAEADLVHLHTGRANWLGGLAARLVRRPAITTRRMDRRVKRGWRTRFLYRSLVRRAVAISPGVLEHLLAAGVPEDKTRLIRSGVDPAALVPSAGRETTRAELGVGEDDLCLLALGALVYRKGIDVLLEAVARVQSPCRLWIAGDGAERTALEARAADLGLAGRVLFLGRRPDAADLLVACDLYAMPSRAEGLGIAALEAMALGRPVVASRVGGLAEAVVDGRTGLLVPPEDPGALAAAIDRALGDAGLRARLGAEGPGRVAEGFLGEDMVDAYEALYREVLAEEGR